MKDALNLLTELIDIDLDWLCSRSHERQLVANTRLIAEGQPLDALYVVLEGLLKVQIAAFGDRVIGTLGPGELVGDMAFMQGGSTSATVTATENSLVLAIPIPLLTKRLLMDAAFAARLYRSIALIATRRLQDRVEKVGSLLNDIKLLACDADSTGARVERAAAELVAFLQSTDQTAIKHSGPFSLDLAETLKTRFLEFCRMMNEGIGIGSSASPNLKAELGRRLKHQILPYALRCQTAERLYTKPRGYAGDYLTMEMIYRNQPQGSGQIGEAVDGAFLQTPACKAIRNRRKTMAQLIQQQIATRPRRPFRITNLSSGPACELFDVLSEFHDSGGIAATFLDIDPEALTFLRNQQASSHHAKHIQCEQVNLIYLALGRQQLDLRDQDFVYSLGLLDYFNDKFALRLLNYVHQLLRPGGRAVLGTFHPRNATKAFMDHILDWRLIHRTESDMNRLFSESAFACPCTAIHFEEEQISFLAECIKQ